MSAIAAGKVKAAEARKRRRAEEAAVDGIIASVSNQAVKDQEFVVQTVQARPKVATAIAGMIRDGYFDKAESKMEALVVVNAGRQDLGRSLGKGVKTFKKLGVSVLQSFLTKVAGDDGAAKRGLAFLTKEVVTTDGAGRHETIGQDRVGEIWHFVLDVNDDTPLPKEHAGSGYLHPLMAVLMRRYNDCGARLEPYKTSEAPVVPGFWSFNPTGESPRDVVFRLGTHTQTITLPLTDGEIQAIIDWEIDAPHTFYAILSSKSRFISIPLGHRLEEVETEFCEGLPMFEPQDRFEYADAWTMPTPAAAPHTPGVASANSGSVPVAGSEVMDSLPSLEDP